jgi:hypothetical protein
MDCLVDPALQVRQLACRRVHIRALAESAGVGSARTICLGRHTARSVVRFAHGGCLRRGGGAVHMCGL